MPTPRLPKAVALAVVAFIAPSPAGADSCTDCHARTTPLVVAEWGASAHAKNGVGCATCHGDAHQNAADAANARIPTPETCAPCHAARVEQFARGKHAKAWAAMKAMPTIHHQPDALIEGMKGCGGCHKIGLKTEEEVRDIRAHERGFGMASCDACHTRHTFAAAEARQPEACMTCHMGFDHPQWEMYSTSKHGARLAIQRTGALPATAAAPTCQSCHMREGDHAVRTAWGFLAVRLPMPEDRQWAKDRTTILQALGVLDPEGKPTARLELVKGADVARFDQADWERERTAMLATCGGCHSPRFAREQMLKGDDMIRAADHLMAEAIREVAALYREGVLSQPKEYAHAFPDLFAFHDAPTGIEQTLFQMFLEHRMRTFQGTFHASPDYALWYGWSEMQRDLTEIRERAAELRRAHRPARAPARKP